MLGRMRVFGVPLMLAIDFTTSIVNVNNFARHPSGTSSIGTSTVASKAQLKIFSDIIARIIIPRKVHIINGAFHFEILVKSQEILGFRVASVEERANFKVEPEFVYIEYSDAQSVKAEVRKVINAAACSLDEGKILIERLSPHEKSQLSAYSAGIYPADALSEEIVPNENAIHEAHSLAIEIPSKVEHDEIVRDDNVSEGIKADPTESGDGSSIENHCIEAFFEKIKDKSNFAYLQNSTNDKLSCFGACELEGTLPEDMLSKLNEWNQQVSSSLSETPKFLTSFGPSRRDPVMILAISNSQRLLVELTANKFGVAIALWNSITKKV